VPKITIPGTHTGIIRSDILKVEDCVIPNKIAIKITAIMIAVEERMMRFITKMKG